MPMFNYKCNKCNFNNDYVESTSVAKENWHPENCPECGEGTLEKDFMSNVKGIGFPDPPGGYAWNEKIKKINRSIMDPKTSHNTNPY